MSSVMSSTAWKIGDLARQTGLSVRTLHYYDEIGLLRPSHYTESGHRLYGQADLARLQQIVSLRHVGFSLKQIEEFLSGRDFDAAAVLQMQMDQMKRQMADQKRLYDRLDAIAAMLKSNKRIENHELIQLIQDTIMYERYYSAEQMEQIKQRAADVGPQRIEQSQHDWTNLMNEVRAEMDKGTDPQDPRVRELARRWNALVEEFTGGDPGIRQSLGEMYRNESAIHGMQIAPIREMANYLFKQNTDKTKD